MSASMIVDVSQVITEHPFLDETCCGSLVERLDAHREVALDRNPQKPGSFVTYGRAAYLDVCLERADPERDYFGVVAESNRALQSVLAGFYDDLRTELQRLLGEPVAYEPEFLALPGVHIFRGLGIRSASEAGAHFDVQYQKLRFPKIG